MTHGDALRLLIANEPDNETARLAYADWLAENGDEAESLAVREHRSMELDIIPALRNFAQCGLSAVKDVVPLLVSAVRPAVDQLGESLRLASQGFAELGRTLTAEELARILPTTGET